MTRPPALTTLHEDDHLVVLVKPAGLATANAPAGQESLFTLARRTRSFLGVVSRLDAPVSGVVVMAKTPRAAASLAGQFRNRAVSKAYVAVVEGRFPAPLGEWRDWRDSLSLEGGRSSAGATRRGDGPGGVQESRDADEDDGPGERSREAHVRARVIRRAGEVSLVELEPSTGRKHQLRRQLAMRRCPIVGDRRYGARLPFPDGIALHARGLEFDHPDSGARLRFEAPLPGGWGVRFPQLLSGG